MHQVVAVQYRGKHHAEGMTMIKGLEDLCEIISKKFALEEKLVSEA